MMFTKNNEGEYLFESRPARIFIALAVAAIGAGGVAAIFWFYGGEYLLYLCMAILIPIAAFGLFTGMVTLGGIQAVFDIANWDERIREAVAAERAAEAKA